VAVLNQTWLATERLGLSASSRIPINGGQVKRVIKADLDPLAERRVVGVPSAHAVGRVCRQRAFDRSY